MTERQKADRGERALAVGFIVATALVAIVLALPIFDAVPVWMQP